METMQAEQSVTGWGVWPRAVLGAGVALVANLAIWAIAVIAGVEVLVPETPNSDVYVGLSVLPLVLSSVLPALVAAVGLLVLRRLSPLRGLQFFQIGVAIVAVLSLGAPLSFDASTGTRLAVGAMHVVTAAAIIVAQSWHSGGTNGTVGESARV